MKSKKPLLAVVAGTMFLLGCSGDDNNSLNCNEEFWAQEVADEASALTAAANEFGEDPTEANCNAFRSAAQDYLDALEEARPCVTDSQRAEFDEAVDDAQDEINAIDCSEPSS